MATRRETASQCSLPQDEEIDEEEQFATAANLDDETLNQAASGEVTPEPGPSHSNNNYETRKAQSSIWSPVRRFICGGINKPSPIRRNSSCGSPCHCCSPSMDVQNAPDQENVPGCHFDDPPGQNSSTNLNRSPQLSGMCSSAIPGSSRSVCPLPKRRRNNLNRPSIRDLQPALKQRRNRQRRGRKRKSALEVHSKGRTRKKPPWLENFFIPPDIWQFLRNYRQENPRECLEDMVENSMSQYREGEDSQENNCDPTCNEEEVEVEDAASVARSLSNPPSIKSLGNARFIRDVATPLKGVSRMCNASCKSPNSVCKKSINATRMLKSVQQQNSSGCCCQDGFSMIGPGTSRSGRINYGTTTSTPIPETVSTCKPKSIRDQWQLNKDEVSRC